MLPWWMVITNAHIQRDARKEGVWDEEEESENGVDGVRG